MFCGVDFESIKRNGGITYPVVATIHIHGSYSCRSKNDIFSEDDIENAALSIYMVNPLGELQVYDPNNEDQSDFYKTQGRLISTHIPYDRNYLVRLSCDIL